MTDNIQLPNDTKIRFCNAMGRMKRHLETGCNGCSIYIAWGDGDLCDTGKDIIAKELGGRGDET